MNRTLFVALSVGLVAGTLTAACSGGASAGTGSGEPEGHGTPPAGGQGDAHGRDSSIHIHAENVRFDPDTIFLKVGDTVRLVLDNHDSALHDLTTDSAAFRVISVSGDDHAGHERAERGHSVSAHGHPQAEILHVAAAGESHGELVFEALEPGEYDIYCSVYGHREAGMVGKIIVQA
jgi:plastocyanin